MTTVSLSIGSFGDIVTAAEMAMKIVQVLYYSQKASEDYQGALTELVALHHELILIDDAVQLDASSGLGEVARQRLTTEVARCYADMQRFLDKTKGITAKGMTGILNKVLWAASEEKELRSLRAAVSRHRAALSLLIGSSNLIISTTTRDEVRACRDTLQELTTMLKPVPHHVLEDMVFVIDPLGDVIRISMIFGLQYKDLQRIIQAYYPSERAGSRHISEGSYNLLYSANGIVSSPLAQSESLKLSPGMTLEMSIVLRERVNFLEQRRTCPRCNEQSKSEIIPSTSWRKCLRCSKFFQVVLDDSQLPCPLQTRKTACSFHPIRTERSKQDTFDDGIQHFRRIEFVCIEDLQVSPQLVPFRLLVIVYF
ncbi:hypothetical protein C8R44DRAFT_769219 [Mycena epipterygia]|nr:hypothetical protein C8R44DRAFT_769219 [Mycena epipterygia]